MAAYVPDSNETKANSQSSKASGNDDIKGSLMASTNTRIVNDKDFQLSQIYDCFGSISTIAKIAVDTKHATKDEYSINDNKLYIKKAGITSVIYDEECEFDDSLDPYFDFGLLHDFCIFCNKL